MAAFSLKPSNTIAAIGPDYVDVPLAVKSGKTFNTRAIEEPCIPVPESYLGLKWKDGFRLGESTERIDHGAREVAKITENTQRDLTALMNDLALIFEKFGISTHEVMEAAVPKRNFLEFQPGLVRGKKFPRVSGRYARIRELPSRKGSTPLGECGVELEN